MFIDLGIGGCGRFFPPPLSTIILPSTKLFEKSVGLNQGNMSSSSSSAKIRLNVGGTLFETSRSTIDKLQSRYFDRLLDPNSGFLQPGSDEVHFIDRDPECFRIILNIARYGEVFTFNHFLNAEVLTKEADFYLLGPNAKSSILRYMQVQRQKEESEVTLLKSILHVCEKSLEELQNVSRANQEMVRAMAAQSYWTS